MKRRKRALVLDVHNYWLLREATRMSEVPLQACPRALWRRASALVRRGFRDYAWISKEVATVWCEFGRKPRAVSRFYCLPGIAPLLGALYARH